MLLAVRVGRSRWLTTGALVIHLFAYLPCSIATAQWAAQASGTKARLRGLCVVSDRVAWASGTGGTFLRTTDGGATWATVYTNRDPRGFLDALGFGDAAHGLALGDPVGGRFVILTTDDGGKSWAPIPPERMPPALPGEGAFAASGTCLVIGEGGHAWFGTGGGKVSRVFRSSDGGRTWAAHDTPVMAGTPSSGIFSLASHDAEHGVAVGGDYQEPGRAGHVVALTSDGGRSWRSPGGQEPGTQGRILIAVGPTGSDISEDGGEGWRPLGSTGFHAVGFAGPTAGWAVGDDGLVAKFEGGVLRGR